MQKKNIYIYIVTRHNHKDASLCLHSLAKIPCREYYFQARHAESLFLNFFALHSNSQLANLFSPRLLKMHPGRPRPGELPPLTEPTGAPGDTRQDGERRAAATRSLRSRLRHAAAHSTLRGALPSQPCVYLKDPHISHSKPSRNDAAEAPSRSGTERRSLLAEAVKALRVALPYGRDSKPLELWLLAGEITFENVHLFSLNANVGLWELIMLMTTKESENPLAGHRILQETPGFCLALLQFQGENRSPSIKLNVSLTSIRGGCFPVERFNPHPDTDACKIDHLWSRLKTQGPQRWGEWALFGKRTWIIWNPSTATSGQWRWRGSIWSVGVCAPVHSRLSLHSEWASDTDGWQRANFPSEAALLSAHCPAEGLAVEMESANPSCLPHFKTAEKNHSLRHAA